MHNRARTVKPLEHPDSFHLQAAVGWLELGNWTEANEELELITPQVRAHPDVLQVRVRIYTAAERWDYAAEVANELCTMMPDSSFGPLHLAHALRKLDRTEAAKQTLWAVAHKFPKEWRILYSLACYCCQLGQRKHALRWLQMAIDVAGKRTFAPRRLTSRTWKRCGGRLRTFSKSGNHPP